MDPIKAKSIVKEYMGRKGIVAQVEQKTIDFSADLFDIQTLVVNSPETRQALICGRRSGKSYSAAYALIKTAYEQPKAECLYLALTLKSAKRIILPVLQDILDRYRIKYKYNYSDFTFCLDNGSFIRLLGADMEKMADRLRGSSFDLTIIDEAQGFGGHLENLINASLIPALRERNGRLILIGTPGVSCSGLFYEITTGKRSGWAVRAWNLTQNKYYSKWRNKSNWEQLAQEELDVICKEEGLSRSSSYFIREYLGEWVEGDDQLVYAFTESNLFSTLPSAYWNYIISVDYGITDPCAIVVGAYSFDHNILHIVDSWKRASVDPVSMADQVQRMYNQYSPIALVVDGNGIGAAFIAQMTSMYNLPFELAEKKDKEAFMDMLNDDFKDQKVLISNNAIDLIEELKKYKWANPTTKELSNTADDHCCDALLYMWRKSLHFKGQIPEPIPEPQEQDYAKYLLEQELERVRNTGNDVWWENI